MAKREWWQRKAYRKLKLAPTPQKRVVFVGAIFR